MGRRPQPCAPSPGASPEGRLAKLQKRGGGEAGGAPLKGRSRTQPGAPTVPWERGGGAAAGHPTGRAASSPARLRPRNSTHLGLVLFQKTVCRSPEAWQNPRHSPSRTTQDSHPGAMVRPHPPSQPASQPRRRAMQCSSLLLVLLRSRRAPCRARVLRLALAPRSPSLGARPTAALYIWKGAAPASLGWAGLGEAGRQAGAHTQPPEQNRRRCHPGPRGARVGQDREGTQGRFTRLSDGAGELAGSAWPPRQQQPSHGRCSLWRTCSPANSGSWSRGATSGPRRARPHSPSPAASGSAPARDAGASVSAAVAGAPRRSATELGRGTLSSRAPRTWPARGGQPPEPASRLVAGSSAGRRRSLPCLSVRNFLPGNGDLEVWHRKKERKTTHPGPPKVV